jgi:hypothetical protein
LNRPLIRAVLVQVIALMASVVLRVTTPEAWWSQLPFMQAITWALTQGLFAAATAFLLRSAWWWWLIHLAFVPALVLLHSLGVHPAWYLAVFVLLLLTYWRTDLSQVPLYLSNNTTADAVEKLLPASTRILLDVGCGHAGLLRRIAARRANCQCHGVEHAPLPWLVGRLLSLRRSNVRVRYGNFWRTRIDDVDVVYAFLSPVPMAALWEKVRHEMRPGSLLISNSFEVPRTKPESVVELDDARRTRLLLYRVPR